MTTEKKAREFKYACQVHAYVNNVLPCPGCEQVKLYRQFWTDGEELFESTHKDTPERFQLIPKFKADEIWAGLKRVNLECETLKANLNYERAARAELLYAIEERDKAIRCSDESRAELTALRAENEKLKARVTSLEEICEHNMNATDSTIAHYKEELAALKAKLEVATEALETISTGLVKSGDNTAEYAGFDTRSVAAIALTRLKGCGE